MVWFCGVFDRHRAAFVALALMAFGLLIEFLQGFLSYRSAEFADAGLRRHRYPRRLGAGGGRLAALGRVDRILVAGAERRKPSQRLPD